MKKFIYLFAAAMGLGLVACDNFDFPNPPAQSNPQEEVFEGSNLTMSALVQGVTQNLIQLNDANKQVELAKVDGITGLPEGYELFFVAELANNQDFVNAKNVGTTTVDNIVCANPDDIDVVYKEIKTLDPGEGSLYGRLKAYANNGSTIVRIGGADAYYAPCVITLIPFKPDFTMEEAYYIVGSATDGAIDPATAIELKNSGASPYDDPVFSTVTTITEEQATKGYQWYIVPATTLQAGNGVAYGPADPTAAQGTLVECTTSNPMIGAVTEKGPHMFMVNMKDLAFDYKLAYECLYAPGPANDWNPACEQKLTTNNYVEYIGFVYLKEELKFTTEPNWGGTNFGYGGPVEGSADDSTQGIISASGGNIAVPEDGLYFVKVNIVTSSYKLTKIQNLGCIGAFNEWKAQEPMAPKADDINIWTGTVTLEQGQGWKFRANDTWDINLGGDLYNLIPSGPDIIAAESGTFTVTLNLSAVPYTATMVKQ